MSEKKNKEPRGPTHPDPVSLIPPVSPPWTLVPFCHFTRSQLGLALSVNYQDHISRGRITLYEIGFWSYRKHTINGSLDTEAAYALAQYATHP
jgi:hypothetical protein